MATITLPTRFGFTSVQRFGLTRGGVQLRSRFTGKRQAVVFPFAVWEFEGTLIDYPEDQGGREVRAFLAALEGFENNFDLPVPGFAGWLGGQWGQPVNTDIQARGVSAAGAKTITAGVYSAAGGIPANGTLVARAGEYFTINNELKILTADATISGPSGGYGLATLNFQPPLRANVAVGNLINFYKPTVRMCAEEADVASWSIQAPVRHGFKISGIEDF